MSISPDGVWVAVASEDQVVKVVNLEDTKRVLFLREQSNSNKHVSWHPSGNYISVSCTDGVIYVYSLTSEEPELIKKLDGVIKKTEADSDVSVKVAWCPDGRGFAAPMPTRDIAVVDRESWVHQRSFTGTHAGEITDLVWSPNGAFLLSAGMDGKIVVWECIDLSVVASYNYKNVCSLVWHPSENTISFATNEGRIYTLPGVVPSDLAGRLKLSTRPAPFINDRAAAAETATEILRTGQRRPGGSGGGNERRQSPGLLNELLGPESEPEEGEDWIVDDDGAGYTEEGCGLGKRRLGEITVPDAKRRAFSTSVIGWSPSIHESFQPSATPWRGKRRYLCLNMVGFIWTVDQDTHNTITIEFHDRESYRDIHFTDQLLHDKACLSEHGALFSCQANGNNHPAMLYYRPHETWTNRSDWRTALPPGEDVSCIALSENYIVACTTAGYVRVYTLFGVPVRLYRHKNAPIVTCTSHRDYVLIVGNGAVGVDGKPQLIYSLENIKRDETLQNNDVVALPPGGELRSTFFSDNGDPVIYDSDGVLLVLSHWRDPSQTQWTPLLDTRTLDRLAGGGKEESYWPVAVAQDKFHCIILKGGEKYPYFPRPLFSEFDFKIPLGIAKPPSTTNAEISPSPDGLEENFVRHSVLLSLQEDSAAAMTDLGAEEHLNITNCENNVDRALLQLLMLACKDDDQGAKALEICGLFRQRRTLDMAIKVAIKYGRGVLVDKIERLKGDAMED